VERHLILRNDLCPVTAKRPRLPPELLLDPAVLEDPYPFYRQLVAEAPVWRIPGTEVVLVSSFAAVAEVVNRTGDFSSNLLGLLYRKDDGTPGVAPFDPGIQALATADPPLHTGHRSAIFPELVAKRMAALRHEIGELAEVFVTAAIACDRVEAMAALANPIPIRVVSKLIGFQDEDPDQLLQVAFTSTGMLAATGPLEHQLNAMETSMGAVGWIVEQVDAAVAGAPSEGILGVVADAVHRGELEVTDAFSVMATLLSAGGESTTSLLGSALHYLAIDADLQARLRGDADALTPFIEEMLRLESPFRYHLRHAPKATELRGIDVPAGASVLLLWGAANRDPDEFDRPDQVVLDRSTPRHHVAFGRGIHLCVGAPLARLEATVILGEILRRTAHFELDPDDPPARENSLVVRRFRRLPLRIVAA
jgi:cytochrome P450